MNGGSGLLPGPAVRHGGGMRTSRALVGMLVVCGAVVLASCAQPSVDPGGGTTDPGASTTPSGATSTPQVPVVTDPAAETPVLPGAHGTGYPPGVELGDAAHSAGGTGAARTTEPGLVYVFTAGSSSCPPVVESDASLDDDGAVSVRRVQIPPATPCTQDFRPFTSVVALPAGVDPDGALTVRVLPATGDGPSAMVELPAGSAPGAVAWAAP